MKGIMAGLQRQFAAIPEAIIFPFNIPTLSGFGAASGFNFLVQDRSGTMSVQELGEQTRKFLAAGRQRPELGTVFTSFDPNYPQVKVELDREKARTLGVPVNEVFQAMSAAMGAAYVNDFNRFGRLYRVYVQADASARLKAEDIGKVWVRSNSTNDMIPLSTLLTIKDIAGTELTTRFNLLRSVEIQGAPAVGYTSGQALAALEQVFEETMPREMGFAYSSLSYQEKIAPPAGPTFIMAIVCVFLLAGRNVRKLAAALGGAPGVTAGSAGRLLRRLDDGVRQQRLRAGRPGHADRPGGQERHPDRRVRQGEARPGHAARGGRSRIGPPALPAHPDDGVCLHSGRRATDAGERCWSGRSECDGHRGLLGHAGRNGAGGVHHSRQLHLRREPWPASGLRQRPWPQKPVRSSALKNEGRHGR